MSAHPYAFIAVVDESGNRIHFDNPAAFRAYVSKFAAMEVVVMVKKRLRQQGSQAMKFYRGVVIPDIAVACGYVDPDDWQQVHEGLAWRFLRLPDGQFGEPRRRSTAKGDLSQDEMSKYIDDVIAYAEVSIPGCRVRRPEEIDLEDIYDPGGCE